MRDSSRDYKLVAQTTMRYPLLITNNAETQLHQNCALIVEDTLTKQGFFGLTISRKIQPATMDQQGDIFEQ